MQGETMLPLHMRLRLFADVGQNTTVDIQHVAVDGIGGVGGQEDGRTAELLWIKPATGRGLGADKRVEWMAAAVGLRLAEWSGLRCGDIARTNGVALDVVATVL